jgi:tape measure domain-containing protein
MAINTQKLLLEIQVKNQQVLGQVANDVKKLEKNSIGATGALKALGIVAAAKVLFDLSKQVRAATVEFERLENRLRSVTNSQDELNKVYSELNDISSENRTNISNTVDGYTKLREATEDLGYSSGLTARITSDLQKAVKVAGGDAATQTQVFQAFSESLLTGERGGREINQILKLLGPTFAKLESETGLTVAQLKNLAKTGNLSAEELLKLLAGSEKLTAEFKKQKSEIDELESALGQAFDKFLVQGAKAIGLTDSYKKSIVLLTNVISNLSKERLSIAELIDQGKFKDAVTDIELKILSLKEQLDTQLDPNSFFGKILSPGGADNIKKLNKEIDYWKSQLEVVLKLSKEKIPVGNLFPTPPNQILKDYLTFLTNLNTQYNLVNGTTGALKSATSAFLNTASAELTEVIFKAKSLDEALSRIVQSTLKALVQGFIQVGLTVFVLEPLRKFLERIRDGQKNINKELKAEIGLRAILALFGFAGGGKITGGNGGAIEGDGYASGGKLGFGGFRAIGGTAGSSNAYVVGERGPELFVPNTAGTVIPNNRMGSEAGVTNINFNISTVDAAGFDELLLSRKGLIVGTIQQAFRQQGRRLGA